MKYMYRSCLLSLKQEAPSGAPELFVSIFIQSYANSNLHVSTLHILLLWPRAPVYIFVVFHCQIQISALSAILSRDEDRRKQHRLTNTHKRGAFPTNYKL